MLQAIHIVDPQTLQVEKTLTSDQNGNSLTNAQNKSRTWNDVAFVEVCICLCCQYTLMHVCMHAPCSKASYPGKEQLVADREVSVITF